MTRNLISIDDLTDEELRHLVDRAVELRADGLSAGERPLAGKVVGIYFRKTSTRTRTAFSSAALRLGGHIIQYGPDDWQTNTGETIEDTGQVLGRMLDVLVARTVGPDTELRAFAASGRMAVINAMSAAEHPTQAIADLTTIAMRFGEVDGIRVRYVGEGNNSAVALALALTRFTGVELQICTPPGYGLPDHVLAKAVAQAERTGSKVIAQHTTAGLPGHQHVIYTTRWQTTGTNKPDPNWRDVFAPFQVGTDMWQDNPDAVFLHDLPAHRGEEVTADVLDGPHSIAFDQAENKMHSAMAILEWSVR